ncbi:hypothetical protein GCM10027049_10470 [Mucilaginibacter puniceus]
MLSSISWQHYLAAIIILSLIYYGYVVLRYYQKEISNLFNRKQDATVLFSNVQSGPYQVMGNAKLDNGVTITESQDLVFSESLEDHPPAGAIIAADITPSQELTVEAGNLIDAFKQIDNKPEFITLLRILIGSYKRYKDEIDLPVTLNRVVELSKGKLMFPIALTDLQVNWA